MKYIVVFIIGAGVGAFGMAYHKDAQFAALTNAHLDHAVSQAAASAHSALAPNGK